MSTSTRTLANRVRTALGWIDAHADSIPGGWGFTSWAGVARPGMSWLHADASTVEALAHLLGEPEVDGRGTIWTWRAEGDRPRLDVYTEAVSAPTRPAGKCGVPDPGQTEGNWNCRLPAGHDGNHAFRVGSLVRRWSA